LKGSLPHIRIGLLAALMLLIPFTGVRAQVPTHFYIGQNELANIDIYTILKSKNNELFIGTNEGLYYYAYDRFQRIKDYPNQKGASFFSLVENAQGQIFSCNLNGQVFEVTKQAIDLYCTIPNENLGINSVITIDDNNDLLFSSNGVVQVQRDTVQVVFNNSSGHAQNLEYARLKHGYTSIFNKKIDEIVHCKKGEYQVEKISMFSDKPFNQVYGFPLLIGGQRVGFDRTTFFGVDKPIYSEFNESAQLTVVSENEVLLASSKSGLYSVYLENDSIKIKSRLFPKTFISKIFVDDESNMYLGTFGKGVIVVPHSEMEYYQTANEENAIRSIVVHGDELFYTDLNKGIIRQSLKNNDSELIFNSGLVKDIRVFYIENANLDEGQLYPNLIHAFSHPKSLFELGVIKDVKKTEDDLMIATSVGLYKTKMSGRSNLWESRNNYYRFKGLKERFQHLGYDLENKAAYISTSSGLSILDSNDQLKKAEYEGLAIHATEIEYNNGEMWVATQQNGILVFQNGTIVRTIQISDGLISNNIRKIVFSDSLAFLIVNAQLHYINLADNHVHQIIGSEVINEVTDIYFDNEKLYLVINNTQVNSLEIDKLNKVKQHIQFELDSVLVNGVLRSDPTLTLSQDENQLSFYFQIKNIEIKNRATIQYRLKGIDNEWLTMPGTDYLVDYKSLSPGQYTFEIYASYGVDKSRIITKEFVIQPPFWKTGWFFFVVFLFIAVTTITVANFRIRSISRTNKANLEKQKLKTDLLESQLRALRSQMNPHFIFNTLNSIQDLVLSQDTDASYDYLVLFSKLVRNTLNYSNKEFIPIQDEVDFLDIYLKLEKLRFGDDLHYDLILNDLAKSEIKIPSLVIQPFIENALLHGLMHKDGRKELKVEFRFDDKLTCIITDNGIGRQKAKEIHQRQSPEHQSFAMTAISKRLSILQSQFGDEIGYTITDLDPNKSNTGTKVEVVIPYKSV
jgi:hypothetical protein